MSKVFLLGLLVPFLFLVSCGEENQDPPGITFAIQEKAFILPGEGDSCSAVNSTGDNAFLDDIPEFRVGLSNIKMTWSRTAQDLVIVYFKVEIEHPVIGSYTASIDGVELDLLLGTANGSAGSAQLVGGEVVPVNIDSASTSFIDPAITLTKLPCSMAFGSIPIPDDTGFFTANAVVTMVAIARGNGKPAAELAAGEVPLTVFDEEAIRIEKIIQLEFDF